MAYQALVGFSGKIGSGKSTTSQATMEQIFGKEEYKVISFADALRRELETIIEAIRKSGSREEFLSNPIFENVDEEDRNKVLEILHEAVQRDDELNARSRTPEIRDAMQFWGTNVRRKNNTNYWVDSLLDEVRKLSYAGYHVCVDDVRYNNEAAAILNNDGVLVRLDIDPETQRQRLVKRDGHDKSMNRANHSSETALDDFPWFHMRYQAKQEENLEDAADIIVDDVALILAQYKTTYENKRHTIDSL